MAIRGPRAFIFVLLSAALVASCGGGSGEDSTSAGVVEPGSGSGNAGNTGTTPPNQRPDPTPPANGEPGAPDGGQTGNSADFYKPFAGVAVGATPVVLTLHDAARDKDLEMRVSWPTEGARLPLIVLSHGYNSSMFQFDPLVSHWVSYGYMVIQPNHSDSFLIPEEDRAGYDDWRGRVADISFVLDSLDAIEAAIPALANRIDRQRIAVAGHSYGAGTAQLVSGAITVFGENMLDPRIRAALLISPQGVGEMLDENSWSGFTNPMMVITGTNDDSTRTGQPYTWRMQPYELAPAGSKHMAVIEGAYHNFGGIGGGGDFGIPSDDSVAGPPNETQVMYVRSTATAFFDAYLLLDPAAQAYLASDAIEVASNGEIDYQYK